METKNRKPTGRLSPAEVDAMESLVQAEQLRSTVNLIRKDPSKRKKPKRNKLWDTRLINAAHDGNLGSVKFAIASGAKVDANEGDALKTAAYNGRLEVVKLLVDKGADVNLENSIRSTALTFAASKGHFEVTKFLVEKGADVNAGAHQHYTALMLAAMIGDVQTMDFLIQKGANMYLENTAGLTAMTMAASNGKLSAVKLLAEKGVSFDLKSNRNSWIAIDFAKAYGHHKVAEFIKKWVSEHGTKK